MGRVGTTPWRVGTTARGWPGGAHPESGQVPASAGTVGASSFLFNWHRPRIRPVLPKLPDSGAAGWGLLPAPEPALQD